MKNTSTLFYDQKLKLWCKPCPVCKGFVKHKWKSGLAKSRTCSRSCHMKGNTFRKGHTPTNAFKPGETSGEKNVNWKGDEASYGSLHDWVSYHKGNEKKCSQCGEDEPSKRYEWANISGEYKREIDDYIRLCKKCHYHYDGNTLSQYQKRKVREKMSNNKSGFKNVCQEKRSGRYYSYIATKGYRQRLGTFDTPEEAYEVYKEKALELFGRY